MNTFIFKYQLQLQPYYHHHFNLPTTLLLFIILLLSPLVIEAQDTNPNSDSDWSPNQNPFHTLGVVLLAVLAFLGYIFLYFFFKHCLQPWASRRAEAERLAHAGLDPSILETLPVFAYSNRANFMPKDGPVECAVCLGLFEGDEKLRLLPTCGHVFHVDCVDPWLMGHSTCPLCRANIVSQSDDRTTADSSHVVELEGGEEEVNVGANNVGQVTRGEIEEGQYWKIWKWNSTGHMARYDGMEDVEKSTVVEKDHIGSRELTRSRSCIILRLDLE